MCAVHVSLLPEKVPEVQEVLPALSVQQGPWGVQKSGPVLSASDCGHVNA